MTAKFYTAMAATEKAGISYRQLDSWVTQGHISPIEIIGLSAGGSGRRRVFDGLEIQRIVDIASLTSSGMNVSGAVALIDKMRDSGSVSIGSFRIGAAS